MKAISRTIYGGTSMFINLNDDENKNVFSLAVDALVSTGRNALEQQLEIQENTFDL